MRDFIVKSLTDLYSMDLNDILLNNAMAVVFGLFVMFTYRLTNTGATYSRKYNVTLGMITIVTTLMMTVISSNVALSLGMVGALSIIRFRTAVKDMRDAGFIFWCISIGIACGVSHYMLAAITSVSVFLFMLIFRQVGPDSVFLLVIRADIEVQNRVEAHIVQHFYTAAKSKMKNATPDSCELVYEIRRNALKRADSKAEIDIVTRLMKIKGVKSVNMVEQSDDLSR